MSVENKRVPLYVVSGGAGRETSDTELAVALIAGKDWAHAATWNRFAPVVHSMASRTLGNEYEAEDVTQEVFYRLFARAHTLRQPESLRSFVISFAVRVLKWELRRKRTGRWLAFFDTHHLPEAPFPGADPEARELLRQFYSVLDRLGTRERMVFALRHLESLTLDEIALAMEISVSTVKRAHLRAWSEVSRWIESDSELTRFLEKPRGRHDS